MDLASIELGKLMGHLVKELGELDWTDQNPEALSDSLHDLCNWLINCLLNVDLSDDVTFVEVDISQLECVPVLLCNYLILLWLGDDVVSHIVQSLMVKLILLVVLDSSQVDKLRVNCVFEFWILKLLNGLTCLDDWVWAHDLHRDSVMLGDWRDQIDHIDIRFTEDADRVDPVRELDKALQLRWILRESEYRVNLSVHELGELGLELMVRAKETKYDHFNRIERLLHSYLFPEEYRKSSIR